MNFSCIEVFILTYNRVEYLKYAINSILNQSLKPSKITIIDNGSSDGTFEFCQNYLNQGVNFVSNTLNDQFGVWDQIKNLSSSKYLMVFHDDDLLHYNYLKYAQDIIDLNNNTVMIGCATGVSSIDKIDKYKFKSEKLKFDRYSTRSLAALLFRGFPLPFCSIVYKTHYFKQINFNFNLYGKFFDRPLILSYSKFGDVVIIKNKLVRTFIHPSQDSMTIKNGGNELKLILVIKAYRDILGTSFKDKWSYYFLVFNFKRLINFYYWNGKESGRRFFFSKAIEYSATNYTSLFIGLIYYYIFDIKSKVRWFINLINT